MFPFSNVFSNLLNKSKKFFRTLKEMTGKRSVKTSLNIDNENKDTIGSARRIADMFNEKFVDFATTVEWPNTEELIRCIKLIDTFDGSLFSFPNNFTEVLVTVGKSENIKAVGCDGVSAEVH